jgi:hypothetical protein
MQLNIVSNFVIYYLNLFCLEIFLYLFICLFDLSPIFLFCFGGAGVQTQGST